MHNTAILIRTDASRQIGLGHIVRCNALAHMLKDDFEIEFICRDVNDAILAELDDSGFRYNIIKSEEAFLSQLTVETIVVLDGYHFDSEYQKQVKATGAKLVCIDDLHDQDFLADLIINHTPGIEPKDYNAQPYAQFALGLSYALLRPVFLEQARKQRKIEKIETVMICFGGSDYKDLTANALNIVLSYPNFKKINVVTGSAYNCTDGLNLLLKKDKRIEHHNSVNEKQMLSIMLASDLAIVPASGILLEVIAAGCIAISGMYTINQKYLYSNCNQSGFFFDALSFNDTDLKNAINKSLTLKVEKKQIIDGSSGKRLLKIFLQLDLQEKIRLRKANISDVKITYKWATNSVVRAYSFTKNSITKEEHNLWIHNKLEDIECLYLIAEMDDLKIGSIRFDFKGKEAIISYLVDPNYHGNGIGQIILKQGLGYLLKAKTNSNLNLHKVVGYVMKTNIPSIKVFESLGFNKFEEDDKFKYEKSMP